MTEPLVTIKQGQIKGTTGTNLDGGKYLKFLGIPFAKPPVGPLRFKAPQPPEIWNGQRDCTKEGHGSLCYEFQSKKFLGSEDCLYLNVFTKQLPQPGLSSKPVMVFIHGGAFTMGSGSEGMHGSKHLMTEDIVLVTFNYRLGVFGFLGMDDPSLEVPGNAALKDQTMALKWVQTNITSFNGDPNNVTIFGVSSGGVSVSFQVLSPSAKGLFHKAIAQSGSALNPMAWGQKNSIQIAENLGQKVSSEKEALNILMEVPAEELLTAAFKLPDVVFDTRRRRPFGPVIEKPNPTAFLTEDPYDLYTSGKYNQVPMIQGVVSNEGILYESERLGQKAPTKPEFGVFWNLGLGENKEKQANVAKLINDFYFSGGITNDATYKLIGDVIFLIGVVKSTKLISKKSASPVYFYVYSRESGLSNIARTLHGLKGSDIKGVAHGGDQATLFNCSLGKLFGVEMTEDNKDAAKQIVKLWTDFARTGRPHENWEPVTHGENLKYFDIGKDVSLKTNPFNERMTFWENILKDLPKMNANLYEKP